MGLDEVNMEDRFASAGKPSPVFLCMLHVASGFGLLEAKYNVQTLLSTVEARYHMARLLVML